MNSELEIIKSKIESLSKEQHIEVLKIIKNESNICINENKSGVFINLSYLEPSVLQSLQKYLAYISDQENLLTPLEKLKMEYSQNANDEPNDCTNAEDNDDFIMVYR